MSAATNLIVLAFLLSCGVASAATVQASEPFRVGVGHRVCFDAPATDVTLDGPNSAPAALTPDADDCVAFAFTEPGAWTLAYSAPDPATLSFQAWDAEGGADAFFAFLREPVFWFVALAACLLLRWYATAFVAALGTLGGVLDPWPITDAWLFLLLGIVVWFDALLLKPRLSTKTNDFPTGT